MFHLEEGVLQIRGSKCHKIKIKGECGLTFCNCDFLKSGGFNKCEDLVACIKFAF